MNKYLKYGWLAIVVIVPVFLNFSKTEQDIFTVVSSSAKTVYVFDNVETDINKLKTNANTGLNLLLIIYPPFIKYILIKYAFNFNKR